MNRPSTATSRRSEGSQSTESAIAPDDSATARGARSEQRGDPLAEWEAQLERERRRARPPEHRRRKSRHRKPAAY